MPMSETEIKMGMMSHRKEKEHTKKVGRSQRKDFSTYLEAERDSTLQCFWFERDLDRLHCCTYISK